MVAILATLLGALLVIATVFSWLYLRSRKALRHYDVIRDIENYRTECEDAAAHALGEVERLGQTSRQLTERIGAQEERIKDYEQVLGHFETVADIHRRIERDTLRAKQLATTLKGLEKASQLGDYLRNQEATLEANKLAHDEFVAEQKTTVAQYQKLLGNLRTAADLQQRIQVDSNRVSQLTQELGDLGKALRLRDLIRQQEARMDDNRRDLQEFSNVIGAAKSAAEIAAQVTYHRNYLEQIKADIESVEEAGRLQEFGFYRARYDFATSEEYADRLDAVRSEQKARIKGKLACVCNVEWTVDGDRREGKRMVDQQVKLMLRAFNGECDAAVGKAKYDNVVSLENRIKKSFDAINKLGETQKSQLTTGYLDQKLAELHLAHEYQEKKQEEREEQRRIREQMREDQKVEKEMENTCKAAEKEEALKLRALEQARAELAEKSGRQAEKLESLVVRLETELKEAIDRKAKAIARAQLTRSGHVYVLSNIGTLGEGVYKIGMTRRLEPLERVDELGGASVPFPFDVHAMIYSEDAPALENMLHRHFASRRVNLVNLRREFFAVSLDEIRAAVAKHYRHVSFVTVPVAEQYRKTAAIRRETPQGVAPLQIA